VSDVDARKKFNNDLIAEFRENGGQVTGMFANRPLLLLTTTGAKSGKPFTTPLAYTKDGDNLIVIASKGGAPSHPDWYHNVVAHPQVEVEVGTEKFTATATPAVGADRQRLYDAQAAEMPVFNDYAAKTGRQIPVVVLSR
jgi:deazaflavin-dependent oxidoreductase (nitroreductase family)